MCFIISGRQVLLANIEYGLNDRKWNGIGGMVDDHESPEHAVVREIAEETELIVNRNDLVNFGVINTGKLFLHVFTADKWVGELSVKDVSLKELRWFNFDELPFSEMWPGNEDWLPGILKLASSNHNT